MIMVLMFFKRGTGKVNAAGESTAKKPLPKGSGGQPQLRKNDGFQ
jgi:hypothetical protein